jgi:hypothetical protein
MTRGNTKRRRGDRRGTLFFGFGVRRGERRYNDVAMTGAAAPDG